MIRKNKKFIDPRYFMDEKLEEAAYGPGRGTEAPEPPFQPGQSKKAEEEELMYNLVGVPTSAQNREVVLNALATYFNVDVEKAAVMLQSLGG